MPHLKPCLPLLILPLLLTGCGKSSRTTAPTGSVTIEDVRVGLPSVNPKNTSEATSRLRTGSWAPVYVKPKSGKDGVPADAFRVQVESFDLEDGAFHYTTAVPALE